MSLRLQNGSLKAVFTFAFLLLSTFMLLPTARATTAVDPEGNYKYFTATVVWNSEAAVQNVPVLLRFSESTISGFDRGDVTESGLEIVDEDGNLLPWEIDTWNATGEILVWVLLPNYHNGAKFTVRYGTEFANVRPPASDVWANYVGVWHLNDLDEDASTYGSYSNSTATAGLDGEKAQASIADEEGIIGKSVKICDATKQGTGYQLGGVFVNDSGTNSPLDLGNTFAISGWFKHKNQDYYYDKFFAKRKKANNQDTPKNAFAIEVGNNGGSHNVTACGSSSSSTKVTFSSTLKGVWKRIMFVYDNKSCRIYENGVLRGTSSIAAVTDNDAPLCFGNMTTGYGSGTGDCAWCGWIDEVRLADGVPTADWIAAEYNAMSSASALELSAASTTDTTVPSLSVPTFLRNADGSFTVSAEVSGNAPASVFCSIGGVNYPMTTEGASLPATYSSTVSNLPAGTYTAAVRATGTGGTTVTMYCTDAFHAGALTVAAVSNAVEETLAPGVFRVSRADSDSTGLPAITFDVAFSGDGLSAIVSPGVDAATIPAGAAYVDIAVTPNPYCDVNENVTLMLTASGAHIGMSSSNTITVINADFDLSQRYVATTGNDANHGITSEWPKKTIASAISSIANADQSNPCTVHVAAGRYNVSKPISVAAAIHIVGDEADPSRVVVSNTVSPNWNNKNYRCLLVNHASAWISGLTFENGQNYNSGGNIQINTNGGVISNCIIRAGMTRNNDAAGSNLAVSGPGIISHCMIKGGYVGAESTSSGKICSVYLGHASARIENCLIDGFVVPSSNTKGGNGLFVENGVAVNCTVVNTTYAVDDADKQAKLAGIQISGNGIASNCVSALNADKSGVLRSFLPGQTGSRLVNCAYDGIAGPVEPLSGMVNPVAGTAESFFEDYANGDYTPKVGGPLVNAGVEYEGMAATDLAGNPRKVGKHIDIGCYECQKTPGFYIIVR